MPLSDHGVAQLACRREAAILDGDDHRLFGVERGAYLPRITVTQPRTSRTARNKATIQKAGKAKRAAIAIIPHHGEVVGQRAFRLAPDGALAGEVGRAASL